MGGGGQSPATHLGGNQFFYFKTQSNPQHTPSKQKKVWVAGRDNRVGGHITLLTYLL